MISLGFRAAKAGFFDRDRVIAQLNRNARKALSRLGAFVRTRARTSLRYRKGVSAPGSPPSAHRTVPGPRSKRPQAVSPLREFLFFSYDDASRSVVIGPTRLNGKAGTAPKALEYGGVSVVLSNGKSRAVGVKARPYMRPALAAELPNIPKVW